MIVCPIIIEEYREQVAKRMEDVGYMNNLAGYPSSVIQEFESFLRTEIDLVENVIRLVLDRYKSSFSTYELQPCIHTSKDLSEALFNILQLEYPESSSEIVIEFDHITRQTKLVVKPSIVATKNNDKSFFNTNLVFTPGWDYKHYDEYISQKFVNLSSTNKIHLKCDVIDGSIVGGLRQLKICSFVLDKLPGYKVFSEPETIHYRKTKQIIFKYYNVLFRK